MIFSSILFLFYFLAPVLVIYMLVPQKCKNPVLFAASLIFFAWGQPAYVFLMLFSVFFNYISGFVISRSRSRSVLTIVCAVNVALLAVFGYSDFFVSSVNSVFHIKIPHPGFAVPVGLAVYTLQALSYCTDMYRGTAKPQKNVISFGLYLSFFPKLIVGPVDRYPDAARQLGSHPQRIRLFADGVCRFAAGLAKKVLIADGAGKLWLTTVNGGEISMFSAWLGIAAFAVQIYYDLSGYSDMAIGLGRMFGFELGENFNYPYISKNMTEFFKRWYISITLWFKEYVYAPLGGNGVRAENYSHTSRIAGYALTPERKAKLKAGFNAVAACALMGLWYGAGFSFIWWGIYCGIILLAEKRILTDKLSRMPYVLKILYTALVVAIGWAFLASADFGSALKYIGCMFNITNIGFGDSVALYRLFSYAGILAVAFIGATPVPVRLFNRMTENRFYWVRTVLAVVVLIICTAYLADGGCRPVLYSLFC